jgi:hypothetical protein
MMAIWESLRRRIDGEVALPGSPAYQASRPPFNARFRDVPPSAILSCASPGDVGEPIAFARRHGLEPATRAGGHSFAAHSSTRGMLVDPASRSDSRPVRSDNALRPRGPSATASTSPAPTTTSAPCTPT